MSHPLPGLGIPGPAPTQEDLRNALQTLYPSPRSRKSVLEELGNGEPIVLFEAGYKIGQRREKFREQDARIADLVRDVGRLANLYFGSEDRNRLIPPEEFAKKVRDLQEAQRGGEETRAQAGMVRAQAALEGVEKTAGHLLRDEGLIEEFRALPHEAQIEGLVSLFFRQSNINVFEQMANSLVQRGGYSPEEINALADTCFSRFKKGWMAIDRENAAKFKMILRRKRVGAQIADSCSRVLKLGRIDGVFEVVDTEVVKGAADAQLGFERELNKERKKDLLICLRCKVKQEWEVNPQTDHEDAYEYLTQEIKKAENDEARSEYLDFRGAALQAIRHRAAENDDEIRQRVASLEVGVSLLENKARPGGNVVADAARLEEEAARLLQTVHELRKPKVKHPPEFEDFFVMPIGNVLLASAESPRPDTDPPEGFWAVVDLRNVSQPQKPGARNAIVRTFTPQFLKAHLQNLPFYEAISFSYDPKGNELVPRDDKQGSIRVFKEPPIAILERGKDFGQKTRLIRKSKATRDDAGQPWPEAEYGDYVRLTGGTLQNRAKTRKITAAVDWQMVIWTARLMSQHILDGGTERVAPNHDRAVEYVNSVAYSDLSKEFKYFEDPVFSSAYHLFKEQLQRVYQERDALVEIGALRSDLASKKRKTDLSEALCALAEITKMYRKWDQDIETFHRELTPRLRQRFEWYLKESAKIQTFIREGLLVPLREMDVIEASDIAAIREMKPQKIIELIEKVLPVVERFVSIAKVHLNELLLAESSADLQSKRQRLLADENEPLPPTVSTPINDAMAKVQYALPKTDLTMRTVVGATTGFSRLHFAVLDAAIVVQIAAQKMQRFRSDTLERLFQHQSEEEARKVYYPR